MQPHTRPKRTFTVKEQLPVEQDSLQPNSDGLIVMDAVERTGGWNSEASRTLTILTRFDRYAEQGVEQLEA